tara:strand:+ start:9826 stop:10056 length:231 start_codon:yes stop_codon:yes gene_type:complete
MDKVFITDDSKVIKEALKKVILSAGLTLIGSDMHSIFNSKFQKWTTRTSKGRKRTVTAAQQKREKIKRKNKVKGGK